jgi:hypothetical protein
MTAYISSEYSSVGILTAAVIAIMLIIVVWEVAGWWVERGKRR